MGLSADPTMHAVLSKRPRSSKPSSHHCPLIRFLPIVPLLPPLLQEAARTLEASFGAYSFLAGGDAGSESQAMMVDEDL